MAKKRIRTDNWAKENPEKHRARVARWRAANPEKVKKHNQDNHERNKAKRNADSRKYRAENPEHMRELSRKWARDNAAKMYQTNAERRAAKKCAIPKWAKDEFDAFAVKEMYDLAIRRSQATGIPWHVDHTVPLRSDLVCGLHCKDNLRVITGTENHRKGNRNWPDMPT
jgi:hypothetical protein